MKTRMLQYMRQHNMPGPESPLLVALSGGRDSVVLLHLLLSMGYKLQAAHANFGLRGTESDSDEQFVSHLCDTLNIPLFVRRFETRRFMQAQKLSLQEAARKLRYDWFNALVHQTNVAAVAVAHHFDDSLETLLINLLRGTGIRGLAGIRPVNGHVIRPLLWAKSSEIEKYANDNQLRWRNDTSNQKDDYLRNRIRHRLIPVLVELALHGDKGLRTSLQLFASQVGLYASLSEELRKTLLVLNEKGNWRVAKKALEAYPDKQGLLYELLSPFGFNIHQVWQLSKAWANSSGKVFFTSEYAAYLGKHFIEIGQRQISENESIEVYPNAKGQSLFAFELVDWTHDMVYSANPREAWLDYDNLALPLHTRAPKTGDRFVPLGMFKAQKLSDFFSNNHFTYFDKQRVRLLCDADDNIIWVCGHRIGNHYRITDKTRRVLIIRLKS